VATDSATTGTLFSPARLSFFFFFPVPLSAFLRARRYSSPPFFFLLLNCILCLFANLRSAAGCLPLFLWESVACSPRAFRLLLNPFCDFESPAALRHPLIPAAYGSLLTLCQTTAPGSFSPSLSLLPRLLAHWSSRTSAYFTPPRASDLPFCVADDFPAWRGPQGGPFDRPL